MFGHQRLLRLPAAAAIAAACCVLPVAACSNGDETATATATVAASTPVATPTSVPGPTATTVPATPTRTPAPAATPTQTSGPQESLEELAVRLVTMMSEQRFSEVVAHFDATMSQVMPVSVTGQAWSQIQAQVGTFQRVERTQVTPAGQYMVVTVTTVFSGLPINIEITFDASRKVAGLFFKPADEYAAPSYANETVFTETEVVVGSAPWKLPGTLTMPNGDGPFPAVVLVHGSGPNNRDETVGPNKPFKDLAWGLATRGIAVLRYDKRTAVYPGELAAIAQSLTIREETVIDARAAADLLMGTAKIDPNRIFVAGHSLGGMLAPMIAAEHDGIAGLVILAGAARPLEEIILQQTRYLAA
ncbi:MAG: alpha/beta fold hydrolase, partial [SAR202 cluster bacterium]|nr:alpha/beta fold hydrolase [SAR202 cluster bacterium]